MRDVSKKGFDILESDKESGKKRTSVLISGVGWGVGGGVYVTNLVEVSAKYQCIL